MMIKIGLPILFVLLIAQPITGQDGDTSSFNPDMKTDTLFACEAMPGEYYEQVLKLVEKNETCLKGLNPKDFKPSGLTRCGPCCKAKTKTLEIKEGTFQHPCTVPKSCAAYREKQYCLMVAWEKHLYQCRERFPAFDFDQGVVKWELAAAIMKTVEMTKTLAVLDAITDRIKEGMEEQEKRRAL